MKVIYGINKIRKYPKPAVALGVFDGVHRGHIRILKEAIIQAKGIRGTSMVLTFWPHPQKEESLYSLEHRLRLFNELGIDVCVVINFSAKFSSMTAESFIKNILVKRINAQAVYVGKNFRFGRGAGGALRTLSKASKIYGFKLKAFEVIKINNKPVSSTLIRSLIKLGRLRGAQRLLGRPVSILGTVIRGAALGRKISSPTANIEAHHEVIPAQGVYAVKVIFDNTKFNGACYIGPRPQFTTRQSQIINHKLQITNYNLPSIEVHIFDFNKDIYGRHLEVQFLEKIRGIKKFSSIPALAEQIREDLQKIKTFLSRHFCATQDMP